jgi:hypothetical protein
MSDNIIIQASEETIIVNDDNAVIEVLEAEPINISSSSPVQNVVVSEENVSVSITSVLSYGGASVAHIELDLLLKANSNSRYKTFTYTSDKITAQKVYEDNTMATQLYDLSYNYSGDSLASIEVLRLSDNFTYTKTFTYNGNGDLISITYL